MNLKTYACLILLVVSSAVHGQVIKVMSYNIRFDNPEDSVNAWPNRKEKVFKILADEQPDFIGIQEALHHQIEDILTALTAYQYIGNGRDDGKSLGEYSAILYRKQRFEVLEENTFWLSEDPQKPGSKSWDAAITRVATWGRFKDLENNRDFLLMNTHFDHIGTEARKNSAAMLKAKAAELAVEIPLVITGDFNCTPEDEPYQVMTDSSQIELIDPAPEPVGTFCSFKVDSMPCRRIDYIFITNEWRADQYKVISENDGVHYPSDHLPVVVNLGWTE